MGEYIILLLAASLLSYLVTPLAARAARSIGAIVPGDDGVIPVLGGLAVYLAFMGSALLARVALNPLKLESWFQPTGLLLGGTLMLAVGVLDDKHTLPPVAKFLGQVAAACVLIRFGIRLEFLPFHLSVPLTILYVVVISNAVNFIDGMDGLASGISGIAGLFFFVLFLMTGRPLEAAFGLILFGSVLGFLRYNLFKPNSIFLGDCGSLVLGFLLAGLAMLATPKTFEPVGILIPVVVLGVPLLDLALAILRRLRIRRSVFTGDRYHPYDLLLHRGYSQKRTASLFYLIGLGFGLTGLAMRELSLWATLGVICAEMFLLWIMVVRLRLPLFPQPRPHGKARMGKRTAK